MAMTPDQLEQLTASDAYNSIPVQTALDQGWTVWWAQVGAMTRTAAEMAIWELSHALEHYFQVYRPAPEVCLSWQQSRDMDPDGVSMQLHIAGKAYKGRHHVEIPAPIHERMLAVDNGDALEYLHRVASRSILTNRKLIVDQLNEAYPAPLVSTEAVVAVRQAMCASVQSRVEQILLDQHARIRPPRPAGGRL